MTARTAMTAEKLIATYAAGARYFQFVDLHGADLCSADLCNANLYGADLCSADLCSASLYHTDLRNADLREADLREADLRNADLREADLRGAVLRGAVLRNADLRNANLEDCIPSSSSHELIAEILRQSASNDRERRKIAGLVLVSLDWCWDIFHTQLADESPDILVWIGETLARYPVLASYWENAHDSR